MQAPVSPPTPLAAAVPAPALTLAQAFGPNSATAAASGAANVTWARWRFTATPASGAALTVEAGSPLVWWYNLAPGTSCESWLCRAGVGCGLNHVCRQPAAAAGQAGRAPPL